MLTRRSTLTLLAAIVLLNGCASAGDRARAADEVTLRLFSAVAAQDGASACAVLAPETAAQVAQSGDMPCAEAILDEDLPDPGEVSTTEVYGQRAQVRLTGDTVFLAVFPGGWRVVAAGCTPRGERPYDCRVQGG